MYCQESGNVICCDAIIEPYFSLCVLMFFFCSVSLQPTCLPSQGEPLSILLSKLRHFFTRISGKLKLCRRLLSGQCGRGIVCVCVCAGEGGFFSSKTGVVFGGGLMFSQLHPVVVLLKKKSCL